MHRPIRFVSLFVFLYLSLLVFTATAQDTLFVYGGPGSLDGKFETAAGLPDRQGWMGMDLSNLTPPNWQISTFNCTNLDPGQPENHAWWCGEVLTACNPEDPPEGYANSRIDRLDWYGLVPDTTVATTVIVTAILNHDTEIGYDELHLQYESEYGLADLISYTGRGDSVMVNEYAVLAPEAYVPHPATHQPAVHLRWEFRSDTSWSDEDCEYPTAGAAQIDRIEVWFDQGGGPQQIGFTETCEPGDPVQWEPTPPAQVGDFSKVWPLLDDLDPTHQNDTPQFAFIDDGLVVPGTGGSPCYQVDTCYGPDEWVVNIRGGLAGYGNYLQNEVWSPPITIPQLDFDRMNLVFTEYLHNGTDWPNNLIYTVWHVRSTTDPTGLTGWSEWRDRDELGFGLKQYRQRLEILTDLLVHDCRLVQLAVGIEEHVPSVWENWG
ncbi:MAG: hypothetical protein ABIF77_13220, partial [bacterium]